MYLLVNLSPFFVHMIKGINNVIQFIIIMIDYSLILNNSGIVVLTKKLLKLFLEEFDLKL